VERPGAHTAQLDIVGCQLDIFVIQLPNNTLSSCPVLSVSQFVLSRQLSNLNQVSLTILQLHIFIPSNRFIDSRLF
jgi:hypothetical protein